MAFQSSATSTLPGIQGDTTFASSNGVRATSTTGASALYASTSANGAAVHGYTNAGYATQNWAVYGRNDNSLGYAVFGAAYGSFAVGVYGSGDYAGGWFQGPVGVRAYSDSGYALYATWAGTASHAAYFSGFTQVNGSFAATLKSFLIDHPLDPENRFLEHSSVESSERKNIYDGIATADDQGVVEVALPPYFDALNRDVRYLLTALGQPAPNLHVRSKFDGRSFTIAGAAVGQEICWQVTGVRKDPDAAAHPLIVEREKVGAERGRFLTPVEHGQPLERGLHYQEQRQAPSPDRQPAVSGETTT